MNRTYWRKRHAAWDKADAERKEAMSKGLHGDIKTLERMLEFKVAKLRTAEALQRETSGYRAEVKALGAAISSMANEQKEITRMRKCLEKCLAHEGAMSKGAEYWVRVALGESHVEQSTSNGNESSGRSNDSVGQSGSGKEVDGAPKATVRETHSQG